MIQKTKIYTLFIFFVFAVFYVPADSSSFGSRVILAKSKASKVNLRGSKAGQKELIYCGNGILEPSNGEACDHGTENSESGVCTPDCQKARCGDGYVQEGTELCDDGGSKIVKYGSCQDDCKKFDRLGGCGDGLVQTGKEECEPGIRVDPGFQDSCIAETCRYGSSFIEIMKYHPESLSGSYKIKPVGVSIQGLVTVYCKMVGGGA